MLSKADVRRLERIGYDKGIFVRLDPHGFIRLRNRRGFCVFYDVEGSLCKVYRHRPSGCRVYPVIYSERDGIIMDDLCPMKSSISKIELKRKGRRLMKLLQEIDAEANSQRE